MEAKHGNLSINSDNIFPIIKKWLYSDHDIFFRELISNGCDAITKLKKLDMMGEYTLADDYKAKIQVIVNPEEKTLKFIDNGIGMTAQEVEEYINQIAFSGAADFIEKYKDRLTTTRSSDISDWDFILPLWWRMRCISTPCLIRMERRPFTGNVTAVQSLIWRREAAVKWVRK